MTTKKDDPKTMILDLAKVLSYLSDLEKTKDQVYVTKEGMALPEGVVIGGNNKVKVMPISFYEDVVELNSVLIKEGSNNLDELRTLQVKYDKLRNNKKSISKFRMFR